MSGCPRSLQVATFSGRLGDAQMPVRLPPQSPSRYIHSREPSPETPSPVAPAVSKSLHSGTNRAGRGARSGCPRSLQVATFDAGCALPEGMVRLPPQSPSRYIQAERNSLFGLNISAFGRGSIRWCKAIRPE